MTTQKKRKLWHGVPHAWLDVVEFSHIARLEFVDDSDVGFEGLEVAVPRPARYDLDMDVKLESRDNKGASGAMRG